MRKLLFRPDGLGPEPARVPDAYPTRLIFEFEAEHGDVTMRTRAKWVLAVLDDRARYQETIATLAPYSPCHDCHKEWPHPGVLSSLPICQSCRRERETRDQERIAELEREAREHICRWTSS